MQPLERVSAATTQLDEAQAERIAAVLAARAAGQTMREIAAAAGITERALYRLVARHDSSDQ